jgi:hypothetical protein
VKSGQVSRVGRVLALCGVMLLLALAGATGYAAGAGTGVVVPPGAHIEGHTYAQWEARAWQWAIANLRFHYSGLPRTLRCTTVGQTGPVWFLGGDSYEGAGDAIRRVCDVPAGRYLFIDDPSDECSTVEPAPFHATTAAGLQGCARSFGPLTSTLTLDGKRIAASGFDVTTAVFRFRMPPHDNDLLVPGATGGRGAAYGQPVMLRPLSAGPHRLVRTDSSPRGPTLRTTYELTVG